MKYIKKIELISLDGGGMKIIFDGEEQQNVTRIQIDAVAGDPILVSVETIAVLNAKEVV